MQRYASVDNVQIGDRCSYDNVAGYVKEVPKIRYVGEVVGIRGNDIEIFVRTNGVENGANIYIPYFLAQ